ncbi:MAG: glutathione S-transferase [Rhodobacteraceae bacterium]|nr:glutathione S-transferase [Paracoccaceae bacterium]
MTLTLHHVPQARSMRSLWLLHEIGLPFDLIVHQIGPDLRQLEYLKLSGAGRVPCLVDGDVVLSESGAITEYLCATYAPELGRRAGDSDWPVWLQWLHFSETIGALVANLTLQHVMLFKPQMRSPVLMKLERKRLEVLLGVLDRHLEGREFVLDQFSGVDTNIGYGLFGAQKFAPLASFPHAAAYFERMQARPAFVKALPPEGAELIYKQDFYEVPNG